jgi:hypothetical protein
MVADVIDRINRINKIYGGDWEGDYVLSLRYFRNYYISEALPEIL